MGDHPGIIGLDRDYFLYKAIIPGRFPAGTMHLEWPPIQYRAYSMIPQTGLMIRHRAGTVGHCTGTLGHCTYSVGHYTGTAKNPTSPLHWATL